jgi:hypothetical protein
LINCDPDWIRTNGPQLRRLLLYPAELRDQFLSNSLKIWNANLILFFQFCWTFLNTLFIVLFCYF